MNPFRNLPIKRKLALAIFLTSLVGLGLAYAILLGYEVHVYRQSTSRNFSMIGEMIASNSTAALVYDDQKVAREILSALQARPGLLGAALYDEHGRVFATYPAALPGSDLPTTLGPDGISFHTNDLVLFHPVMLGDRRVGTLYLKSDLQVMYRRLTTYGLVLLGVLVGSSLLALLLSKFFQRGISDPLTSLATTARIVSQQKDYSVRATKINDDELGQLTEAFNSMLDQIERGDAALRASEQRLSAVFHQAGAGIVQADLTGHFRMVNDCFCQLVGRTREELLELRTGQITHPDDLAENDAVFHRVRSAGTASVLDKRFVRPDGTLVWVRKSIVALRNSQGEIDSTLAVVQDITASKCAEQAVRASEARFRFVTDHAPVLLAHMDRDYRYKFVNAPYAQRYGCEPNDAIGQLAVDIVGRELFEEARPRIDRALAGEEVQFELHLARAGVGPRWTQAIYTPERNAAGAVVGFVAVHTDITLRKQAEQAMEFARDQAQAASRAKDDFLAALSHELRTPLSPVLLLASDGAVNPDLSPAVRADFATIRKNADLEARLIDDLLDLTRITRGKLTLEINPSDLQAIVNDAIAIIRPEMQQRQIGLTLDLCSEARFVMGDAVRLQQVVWNVLKNAVKFTPETGKISVESRLDAARGRAVLTIADTGIGLAPEELDRIFQAFSQGNHAGSGGSHRFGGLGLGLAISRMLIELQGGTIRATSGGPGTGAAFVIELPLAPKRDAAPAHGPAGAPVPRPASNPPLPATAGPAATLRARILLVDDHAPTRTTLAHLLNRRRYEVVAASSATEAINLAAENRFDVVISDIGLPDGDGYALLGALRVRQPGLPGIALSGYGMEDDLARSRAAGFVEHLTKPISIGTLERALTRIVGAP